MADINTYKILVQIDSSLQALPQKLGWWCHHLGPNSAGSKSLMGQVRYTDILRWYFVTMVVTMVGCITEPWQDFKVQSVSISLMSEMNYDLALCPNAVRSGAQMWFSPGLIWDSAPGSNTNATQAQMGGSPGLKCDSPLGPNEIGPQTQMR